MNILSWIIFGLIIGITVNFFDRESQESDVIGIIILSVVGSILGGLLANLVFGLELNKFNLSSLLIAMIGALTLSLISKIVGKT